MVPVRSTATARLAMTRRAWGILRMTEAIFLPEDGRFMPTELAGSPWGDALVHGGPPAGLLARAIERFEPDPEMQVVRLTIDLFRPVPKAPLEVTVRSARSGRRIHVVDAALVANGVEVCRATGLLLRRSEAKVPAAVAPVVMPPGPEGIDGTMLARGARGERPNRPGFHTTIEARWVTKRGKAGPQIAWLRMPVPLLPGEALTPLVRVAATSDFVNALSGMGAEASTGFINTDLTLYLHRYPDGEWICLEVSRQAEAHGLGVARALLYDARGPIGTAVQAVLANTMR